MTLAGKVKTSGTNGILIKEPFEQVGLAAADIVKNYLQTKGFHVELDEQAPSRERYRVNGFGLFSWFEVVGRDKLIRFNRYRGMEDIPSALTPVYLRSTFVNFGNSILPYRDSLELQLGRRL